MPTRSERNQQKVTQYEREQELESTRILSDQKRQIIMANTKLEQAKVTAERRELTEKAKLEAELTSAQTRLEGARKKAEAIVTQGKAEATVIAAQNQAVIAELKTAVEGFPSPADYAQYQMIVKMAPALAEIFASDTSEFARLFSDYMTPIGNKPQSAEHIKPLVGEPPETQPMAEVRK
jgi:uncharacterized membrane protein YqiK